MGLTGTCGAALDEERRFQLAISGGGVRTDLSFDGNRQHLEEASAAVSFVYRPSALSFQVSAGAVLAGSFTGSLGDYDLKPGFLASASIVPTRSRTSPADQPDLTATDLRASVVLGKRLFDVWLPYVGGAVFGGPVFFAPAGQSRTGNDVHHYRLTAGSSFSLPAHLEAFVEVGFLGEQAVLGGLGWTF